MSNFAIQHKNQQFLNCLSHLTSINTFPQRYIVPLTMKFPMTMTVAVQQLPAAIAIYNLQRTTRTCEQWRRNDDNGGGGLIFIFSFSTLLISFESGKIYFVFRLCKNKYMNMKPPPNFSLFPPHCMKGNTFI